MSPARIAVPSEAELIEIEGRASAIGLAIFELARRGRKLEARGKGITRDLVCARQRLEALRDDVRRLIELARERGGR